MNDNPRGAYAIIMAIFLTIFGAVAAALRRNPAILSQTHRRGTSRCLALLRSG
ncbi:MAG: hypothetical protein H0V47_15720 [Chloroflexia bacterium]|nr:hypothetical protein [Chloroflexia bacterium]